jgi:hypothetical protein
VGGWGGGLWGWGGVGGLGVVVLVRERRMTRARATQETNSE